VGFVSLLSLETGLETEAHLLCLRSKKEPRLTQSHHANTRVENYGDLLGGLPQI